MLDRVCRRVVGTEVQLQRHPRLALSKKPKEHVGSRPIVAFGCTKPFSLQLVQVRVRYICWKAEHPLGGLVLQSVKGNGSKCSRSGSLTQRALPCGLHGFINERA